MTSFLLRSLLFLAFIAISSQKIALTYSYGHNQDDIEQIFKFSKDDNSLTIQASENHYPLELGKALGFMARCYNWSENNTIDLYNLTTPPTVTFMQPQDQFFIWNNLQRPLPAPAKREYLKPSMQEQFGYSVQIQILKANKTQAEIELEHTDQSNVTGRADLKNLIANFQKEIQALSERISRQINMNIYILNKQLALNQIAFLSSSSSNISDEEIVIHALYQQHIFFPEDALQFLSNSIENANTTLQIHEDDTKSQLISQNISDAINQYKLFLTDTTPDPSAGLKGGFVTFDPNLKFVDPDSTSAYVPYLDSSDILQVDLEPGEVLYAQTDESFTLWMNHDRTKAYLVDAGNLFLSLGLRALVKNSENVKDIYVTVTHFHLDHTQALAPFILQSVSLDTIVHLYIPDGILKGFVGWFIQFNHHMTPLINNKSLQIHFVDDKKAYQFGDYPTNFTYPWNNTNKVIMKHVLPNVSPVINFGNNNYAIIAGDLTPVGLGLTFPEEFLGKDFTCPFDLSNSENVPNYFTNYTEWIEQVFDLSDISSQSKVDLYLYSGMFEGALRFQCYDNSQCLDPKDFYNYLIKTIQEKRQVTLSIIETHVKDENFNCKFHTSFS